MFKIWIYGFFMAGLLLVKGNLLFAENKNLAPQSLFVKNAETGSSLELPQIPVVSDPEALRILSVNSEIAEKERYLKLAEDAFAKTWEQGKKEKSEFSKENMLEAIDQIIAMTENLQNLWKQAGCSREATIRHTVNLEFKAIKLNMIMGNANRDGLWQVIVNRAIEATEILGVAKREWESLFPSETCQSSPCGSYQDGFSLWRSGTLSVRRTCRFPGQRVFGWSGSG